MKGSWKDVLAPVSVLGALFGLIRFGYWLLFDLFRLDIHGALAAALAVAVYVLSIVVIWLCWLLVARE